MKHIQLFEEFILSEGTTPQFKKLIKRAKELGIETIDDLDNLISDEFDDESMPITGADFEIAKKKLRLSESIEEGFKHAKKRAYKEVRSYKEAEASDFFEIDHLLMNRRAWKIVAGYTTYNVPNYSKYTGPDNKSEYVIISAASAKKPAPYLDQKPVDYTNKKNWEE